VYAVVGGSQDPAPILVAGGGGGSGGGSTDDNEGGLGGSAVVSAGSPTNSVWPGNDGQTGKGRDGGDGGAGGAMSNGTAGSGGDAETLSGNSGGGGGGGGYLGGAGGYPGQADVVSYFTGSGGGGGSGSSYASSLVTSNAVAAPAAAPSTTTVGQNGNATVQWVSILTTALTPLQVKQRTSQQLQAYYAGSAGVTWQVSGGALPAGLALSPSGTLSGTPIRPGQYSYQATVSSAQIPSITSVMTYSGTVTAPSFRPGRGGRT